MLNRTPSNENRPGFFSSTTLGDILPAAPNRRYYHYEWRHTIGCHGISETTSPLTADEWQKLLFRWNVLGAGQWQYFPLD